MKNKINDLENRIVIRHETEEEYHEVENVTREAFWNIYYPGSDSPYLVHIMRSHKDYLPEYSFVAVLDGKIVGSIQTTKAWLKSEDGKTEEIISFGPFAILPEFQRQGIGKFLIRKVEKIARQNKIKAIVISGNPSNYSRIGFVGSKKHFISDANGKYPATLLVKILDEADFGQKNLKFIESSVFGYDWHLAVDYDKNFKPKEKGYDYRQEEAYILGQAFL